ncbi:MAG: carboxypeptidase regulatory-like domain-containing protein [Chitinophagaceae bacterium]|nr:carboxypeptidase regulatory-like domain-containing protein [Chitinophagaceae bacterium]
MKKTYPGFIATLIAVFILSAFVFQNGGSIKGKAVPAENALRVMAVSGKDTLKSNVVGGNFLFTQVKPGMYELIIEAIPPYEHKVLSNIPVKEGETTDMGEIQLTLK